jgi:hypothetical protein
MAKKSAILPQPLEEGTSAKVGPVEESFATNRLLLLASNPLPRVEQAFEKGECLL